MAGHSYHNCNLIVRSSRYMVFDKKSIPIVACKRKGSACRFRTFARPSAACEVRSSHLDSRSSTTVVAFVLSCVPLVRFTFRHSFATFPTTRVLFHRRFSWTGLILSFPRQDVHGIVPWTYEDGLFLATVLGPLRPSISTRTHVLSVLVVAHVRTSHAHAPGRCCRTCRT